MREIPETIANEEELEEFLATPYAETVDMMKRIEGDIMILGAGGKIGPSLPGPAGQCPVQRRAVQDIGHRIIPP